MSLIVHTARISCRVTTCRNCHREMPHGGYGRAPCGCDSGYCDDCCCGWAERCPDCGSADHEQYDRRCEAKPGSFAALNEFEQRHRERRRAQTRPTEAA